MTISPLNGEIVTKARISNFIPQVWTGQIRKYRNTKFLMQQGCRFRSFEGQKGDTYSEPLVGRAAVYPHQEGEPVVLQAQTPGGYELKIDQGKESSFAIGDIVKIQSQYDTRAVYSDAAGYAMKRDLDNSLLALRAAIPPAQQIFVTADGTAAGNPLAINDAAIRAAMQYMEEIDTPDEDRMWFVGPAQHTALLGIDKFINADYVNGRPVMNGIIGSLYGIPVMKTAQIKRNGLDTYVNGEGAIPQPGPGVIGSPYMPTQDTVYGLPRGQTGNEVANPFMTAMLAHKDWAYLCVQKNFQVESGRIVERLTDVLVTKQVYAAKLYRGTECVLLHTAA